MSKFALYFLKHQQSAMLRPYLGEIGHISVILTFISSLIAAYFYWKATAQNENQAYWQKNANRLFVFQLISVVIICASLFAIIFNHYFEYHYAWDNSSMSLPLGYAISCFWQDQEGSFLLWMFWNAWVGLILILTNRKKTDHLQAPVMFIITSVQVFLSSMILGVVFFEQFKIGSSPFLLLKQSMPDLPVWQMQPDFVPKDGNGLNPLLQNYWMVIHPPTLFLGFSLTMVPFAMAMASLWKKDFHGWLNKALPWSLTAAVILGTGIMMGGIWAYETLNFGGYWNWDPVENAVYVPWIVLVASFHTVLLARKSSTALKYSYILIIAQFILILYSTFLTRSGILGNASVHSFTDLGLSGQLMIYLFVFLFGSILLSIFRWKLLPKDNKELQTWNADFWIIMGVLVLSLAAFQVIITTSIPVYNSLAKALGIKLNMALPSNQIKHYTGFQMWLFMGATILTGIAQYLFWRKTDEKNLKKLLNPLIIALFVSSLFILLTPLKDIQYILLLVASMFAIVANAHILFELFKGKIKVAGGAMAHIGLALMLIGIMYSSAYEKTVSINTTGSKIFSDSDEESKENVLLWLNRPYKLKDFSLNYAGQFLDVRGVPGYIEKKFVQPIVGTGYLGVAKADIVDGSDTLKHRGDTLAYEAENTYFEVNYTTDKGKSYNLFPRFQKNEKMGNVVSPDIKKFWNKDVYSHVTYVVLDEDKEWGLPMDYTVALKDTFFLNDYVAILDDVQGVREIDGMKLEEGDAAAVSTLRILDRDGERIIRPAFVIKSNQVWSKPVTSNELGLRAQLSKIDPLTGQFTFSISRSERDYIVLKAIEKPLINLLWLGIALLVSGISIAAIRRFKISVLK